MGTTLGPPPDQRTPMDAPAWQTWFALIFKQFGKGNLGNFTVVNLPTTPLESQQAYAINGRKVGESAGLGTGVPVYYSNGSWRVYSTDAPVSA
jgi:hypothetical protein